MSNNLKGINSTTLGAAAMSLLGDQRTIAYRAGLTRICGGAPGAGVLLAQLLFWAPKIADSDGWFRITAADLSAETGMSDEAIKTAGKRIEESGFIERKVRGLPATTHYRIRYRDLVEAIAADAAAHPESKRRQPAAQAAPPAAEKQPPYVGEGADSVSGNPGNLTPASDANQNPGFPDAINKKESESDVKEVSGKKRPGRPRKVRAEGAPLADPHPVDFGHPALNLYHAVTGRKPALQVRQRIIEMMPAGATVESLTPYWNMLIDRGGNPLSLYWLGEWAARKIKISQNGAGRGAGKADESAEYKRAAAIKAAAEAAGGDEIESAAYREACEFLARGSGEVIEVSAKDGQL